MCVGHFNPANDLAGIDVCDARSLVGVGVGANNVSPTSAEVVVLAEEVACDGIGILGGVDSECMCVDGLVTGVGKVRAEPKGLSAGGCCRRDGRGQ